MRWTQSHGEDREAKIVPINDEVRAADEHDELSEGEGGDGRRILKASRVSH